MNNNNTEQPRRGRGRPATRRDVGGAVAHVHVKCSPRDKGGFVLAAREAGLSLSEWLISVAREAVPVAVWQRIEKNERGK